MGECYNKCYVAVVANTGTTEDSISFVDCSGNTQNILLTLGDTLLINLDINYDVSGNTSGNIGIESFDNVEFLYTFSSCCEDNQAFSIFGTSDTIPNVFYAESYFDSETGDELQFQCSEKYSAQSVTSCPPLSSITGSYISGVKNQIILEKAECSGCTETYPCLTQCYGLLACEGIYDLITSSDPSLSGYVDTYVNIDILTPTPESPTTQFLVKDLGVINCTQEYTFTYSASTGTCDCQCYRFKTPSEPFITSFVDCEDNLLQVYLPTGKTTSICSKVRPIFDTQTAIPVKLGGLCVNGDCPDLPVVTIEPRNECDVITIFPMDVSCLVTHPSTPYSFDGEAQLLITGGTPPYTVSWEIGSVAPTIINLNVGNYNATVTDFYNDFEINTTCVLTAETPATTTTTSTTTLPSYDQLCLQIFRREKIVKEWVNSVISLQLLFDGYLNNKPTWKSGDDVYKLYWNTGSTPNFWQITGYTAEPGVQLINYNPAVPPLTGWQYLGSTTITNLLVTQGICDSVNPVYFEATTTDTLCEHNGTITISASGGDGVYEYSIDNGNTWTTNPIFQNLGAGPYQVHVRDGLGTTVIQTVIVNAQPTPTVNLNLDVTTSTFGGNNITITSDIPLGYTLSFTLNLDNVLNYWDTTNVPTFNNILTVTNPAIGAVPQVGIIPVQTVPYPVGDCNPVPIKTTIQKHYETTLTITNGQTITGTFTNQLIVPTTNKCNGANRGYQITITNPKILNCECCEINLSNTQSTEGSLPILLVGRT